MALKRSVFTKQIQELEDHVADAATRLGINIHNKEDWEALLSFCDIMEVITDGKGFSGLKDGGWMDGHTDATFFLSIASNLLELSQHGTDEEKIQTLNQGFFHVAFTHGIIGNDLTSHVCPSCIAKNYASSLGKTGAKARHAETYALRDEVIAYWEKNFDAAISADKAATALTKHFPLSHRKLSEYIAAEKKLRRTSKA